MHSIFYQESQEDSEKLIWINQNKEEFTSIISDIILLFLPCEIILDRQTTSYFTILLLIHLTYHIEIFYDFIIDLYDILSNNFILIVSVFF